MRRFFGGECILVDFEVFEFFDIFILLFFVVFVFNKFYEGGFILFIDCCKVMFGVE